ncbi:MULTISPECIES: hypothetical protein [unclassified Streptomyces]|uniref:hypothetical protein n=1 Tax=unclassified Streptomyces TaxID=2593676 RepID=UPI003248333D
MDAPGAEMPQNAWRDMVSEDSVTFLVKYEDFTGRAIAHCDQPHHEDLGMMQAVDCVEP